jgi:DNA-binding LacI/PurR family transcriptional regulator
MQQAYRIDSTVSFIRATIGSVTTRRATISDVAREAGVSPSTASVVFSGKTPVSDSTRKRVLDAAERLGYTGPDPRAASLRRGRSGIVGVVFENDLSLAFLDPVQILVMDGLAEGVAPRGAGLLLLRDNGLPGTEPSLTSAPIDAAVLIGCSPVLRQALPGVLARGIPLVVIEGDAGDDVPSIRLDNREAERQVASHLRSLGHDRVAIVTLPRDTDRVAGWIEPGTEDGIDFIPTRLRLKGARDVFPDAPAYAAVSSSIDAGYAAGRSVLSDPATRPTAIVAQSDLIAAGVIRAAEDVGLRVPDDVSVTGFDGIVVDGLAPYVLTTMVQPAKAKGRAAAEAVGLLLDGTPAPTLQFTCTFRAGNTTAPPAAERSL